MNELLLSIRPKFGSRALFWDTRNKPHSWWPIFHSTVRTLHTRSPVSEPTDVFRTETVGRRIQMASRRNLPSSPTNQKLARQQLCKNDDKSKMKTDKLSSYHLISFTVLGQQKKMVDLYHRNTHTHTFLEKSTCQMSKCDDITSDTLYKYTTIQICILTCSCVHECNGQSDVFKSVSSTEKLSNVHSLFDFIINNSLREFFQSFCKMNWSAFKLFCLLLHFQFIPSLIIHFLKEAVLI